MGAFPPGTLIASRFSLESLVANESGSWVYLARDTQAEAPPAGGGAAAPVLVVLRLISPAAVGPRRALLAADLGKAQRLTHKNLLRLIAFGEHEGQLYVVSEAPNGHSLRQIIDASRAQNATVGAQAAHTLLGHVANALTEVHHVLPHGALSPAVVHVERSGRVCLADVGLARGVPGLARRGAPAGFSDATYIAPEVVAGASASVPSDVYSLAVILYEALTGAPPTAPYQAPSQIDPSLSPSVDAVLARALAAAPQARPATAAALVEELGMALGIGLPMGGIPAGRNAPGSGPLGSSGARRFNPAEAAGLDADTERWLVQKDRLDYGPYSMAQIKHELERGTFAGHHMIVDTETGERVPLKEHPQLGEFTRLSERRLEAARRARAEQSLEVTEKKKSRVIFTVVGLLLIGVGLGAGYYILNRKAAESDALASRVGEADVDAFLKGVKLDFTQHKKARPAGRRSGGGSSKGGADEWNNDMVLGDVTKGGGDESLSDDEIQRVMMGNYRKLVPCVMEEKRRNPGTSDFDIDFVVLGSGKVSAVKANGHQNGPLASCVLGRMQSFGFRKFNGNKTIASWSMAIR